MSCMEKLKVSQTPCTGVLNGHGRDCSDQNCESSMCSMRVFPPSTV